MKTHAGHRERLRERYRTVGIDGLAEHEILELLLFSVIPQRDTKPIAYELLERYGTLAAVFEAHPDDLQQTAYMNPNAALLLSIMPGLFGRYQQSKQEKGPQLLDGNATGQYCVNLFADAIYEAVYVLCLDMNKRVIRAVQIQAGTLNEAAVYSRLLVETVLRHQAAFVILAHNHPGGSTTPSEADMTTTVNVQKSLEIIGVELLDHIIVSGQEFISFAGSGFWKPQQAQKMSIPPRKRKG